LFVDKKGDFIEKMIDGGKKMKGKEGGRGSERPTLGKMKKLSQKFVFETASY